MTNLVSSVYTGGTGTALSKYFDKIAIDALLPNAYLLKMGTQKVLPKGQNKFVFNLATKSVGTVAGLTITEGTTPTEGAWQMTQAEVTLVQLGEFVKFSDVLLHDTPVELMANAIADIAANVAAVADLYVQDTIDAGTNVRYSGTATSRTTIGTGDNLKATDISAAVALLRSAHAKTYEGNYMMAVASPLALHDLRQDTGTGGWLDANKYVTPDKIFKGEVGAIGGARVVESSNIASYVNASNDAGAAGNIDVFPTYVFGKDAFGIVTEGDPKSIVKMPGSGGTKDPLDQEASVGVKFRVGCTILRQPALYRIESASTLANNAS